MHSVFHAHLLRSPKPHPDVMVLPVCCSRNLNKGRQDVLDYSLQIPKPNHGSRGPAEIREGGEPVASWIPHKQLFLSDQTCEKAAQFRTQAVFRDMDDILAPEL